MKGRFGPGWFCHSALALPLFGFGLCGCGARCGASASPRSRIVFNIFWGLSRLERRLDQPQNMLKAAWIGVMQKKCLKEGRDMHRVSAMPSGGGDAGDWGAHSRSSGGCRV